jgi:hypothetical protein
LLNLLHVLGRLVALEPAQASLLEAVLAGPLIAAATLLADAPGTAPARPRGRPGTARQMSLLDE